jgi:hypothetical protein
MRTKDVLGTSEMCSGGCVFVDHASGNAHVEFQQNLNTHETLRTKERCELCCRDHGIVPQQHQSNNGSQFALSGFAQRLLNFEQIVRFAGAGAHHSDGVAERAVGAVVSMAQAVMLHAAVHWPEVSDAALWPQAVQHAVCICNQMPNPSTGLSPFGVFARNRWPQHRLHDLHVWGCPVCVLDKTLADGKKLPRWKPRS